MVKLLVLILTLVTILTCNAQNHELYDLKTPMESRSISFEKPEGKPGSGGITFTNENSTAFRLFYQMDYTINDKHSKDVGRLHVLFRRENATTEKKDFELQEQKTWMNSIRLTNSKS